MHSNNRNSGARPGMVGELRLPGAPSGAGGLAATGGRHVNNLITPKISQSNITPLNTYTNQRIITLP